MKPKKTDYKSLDDINTRLGAMQVRFSKIMDVLRSLKKILHIAGVLDYHIEGVSSAHREQAAGISLRGDGSGGVKSKLPKIDLKKLTKQFNLLVEVSDQYEELEGILAILEGKFSKLDKANAIWNTTVKMMEDRDKEYNRILDLVKDIAEKNVSPAMSDLVEKVYSHLEALMEGTYGDFYTDLQVMPTEDALHFVAYFVFNELTDDTGVVYDEYYIMVTEVIPLDKVSSSTFYVNVSKRLLLPGKFSPFVKVLDPKKVPQAVSVMMSNQRFLNAADPRNVPVSEDELVFDKKMVKKSSINEDGTSIIVELTPKYKGSDLQEVVADLVVQIKKSVRKIFPRNKDILTYRRLGGANSNKIEFMFEIPNDVRDKLNKLPREYKRMQEMFDLTDDQMKRVTQALEGK